MTVDLVLHGGPIRTLDAAAPLVYELAIRDGRVASRPVPEASLVDLAGCCVVPGLADAHVHFPTWSLAQRQVRLEDAHSLEDAVAMVEEALPAVPPGAWLRGVGWRDGDWTERPTRAALDAVAPETPVGLFSKDYHSLWLNSAALARADDSIETPGGVVERDERGEPTGVLRENAAWAFRDRHARPTVAEMLDASRAGLRVAAARGVTAIHDKDGWLGAFEVFARLRERDELTLRVWQSFPWDRLDDLRALGIRSGFGDDMLRIGYLKGFMDGTLGSATAHLLDGSGVEITTRDELEEVVRRAAGAHFPVAVHAIGDAANRAALDAFAATRDAWEPPDLRPRIEHAQLLAPEDVARFRELGVAASVQFSHAPSDRDLADRLWEGRPGAYAYRSLLDAGAVLANGSDAPVEELDPLAGIVAGALRTLDERPPWRPEQAVTVEAALRASTVAPAWLEGEEHRRGTLATGMLADLVVLDRDPLACTPAELREMRVLATMVGGRWTHVAAGSPVESAASP
ncbi:MAG: amidohydrolase [Thermoleophilaceae bacterium]|nr:amidohydrolase [Thermoleophilaceae bacterium]